MKSTKLEMKIGKSQQETEIQGIIETTISNYMPIKWTTWKKWTNFKKCIVFQNWTRRT